MTILYKLFGVPRTLDEFIDRIKKEGYNQVDVTLTTYDDDTLWTGPAYHGVVGVKSGKRKLILEKDLRPSLGFCENISRSQLEQKSLKKAIETAEKLQECGLEATINSEPVNKSKVFLK